MKPLKALPVLILLALLPGCATGGSRSGMATGSSVVEPAKSTANKVSVGGENRVRANFWTRHR